MALTFRAVASNINGFGSSVVVDKPTGVADDDMMLLHVSLASVQTITAPAGWSLVATKDHTSPQNNRTSVYSKIASGEGANYTVSLGGSTNIWAGIIAWYSSIAADIVVDVSATGENAPATTSHVAPSVTTTKANAALHNFYSGSNSIGGTPHSGMTERWDSSGASSAYLMTEIVAATGSTGTRTMTGNSVITAAISVAIAEDSAPPTAPSGLTATAISQTQVNLAWTDNSSDETGFKVEWSANGSTGWTLVSTTAANATSYSHTSLTEATAYYYRVSATNASGDSGYTTANTVTWPNAPTVLVATPSSATAIALSWTDNSAGETGFKVERSSDGTSGWTQINTTVANDVTYDDIGAIEATTLYYRVRAYTSGGNSAYTSVASALTVPAAPTVLSAVAYDDTRNDLTWTDNSAGETGFKIERSANGSTGWTQIGTNAVNDVTYSNTGLLPSSLWYYRVCAYNTTGNSTYSNTASVTTSAAPQSRYDIAIRVSFDWNRDTSYTNESAYVISAKGSQRVAPSSQSITASQGQVAQCTIVLNNSTGRFSSLNAAGALYADIGEGKAYQVPVDVEIGVVAAGATIVYTSVFQGYARIPSEATLTPGQAKTITFDCRSKEDILINKKLRTTQADFKAYRDSGVTEAEFIADLVAEAAPSLTLVSDGGLVMLPWAYLENESVLEAIWQLCAATGGRFYGSPDGTLNYENAAHWLYSPHNASVESYTRATGFQSLELSWNDQEIAEEASVSWSEKEIAQPDVIYDSDHIVVPAGVTVTVWADFSAPAYEITAIATTAGTNGGVDLSAAIAVTPTYYAQSAKLVIVSTSGVQANVRIKISGKVAEDSDSQTVTNTSGDSFWTSRIGRSRKVSGNRWVQSEGQANMLLDFIRNRQVLPTLTAKMKNCPGDNYRRIGDRVTITDSEVSLSATDFFVTGLSWAYSSKGYFQDIEAVRCVDLYPHLGESPTYFIVGTNKLGAADALRGRVFF